MADSDQCLPLLGAYIVAVTALLVSDIVQGDTGIFAALVRRTEAVVFFNTGLAGSILVYRAFFHRLRRFPGPFLAELSRFCAMSTAAKNLQANVEAQRLHAEYGDFVRVGRLLEARNERSSCGVFPITYAEIAGPRELSINRSSAIGAIYGPPTRCTRSPWYGQVSDDVSKISINSTRDMELHRRRRRAWDRGLSFRALNTYEPRITAKVDLLLSRIDGFQGKPIDATKYCMFFGFDVMGDVGLPLESGEKHRAIRGLHDNMAAVGILGTVPWLLSMLSEIPGDTGTYEQFTNWCGQGLKAKRKILNHEKAAMVNQDPKDVMSWLLRAEDEHDQPAPPGEGAFQEDSRLMIIAGSAALTNAWVPTTPGAPGGDADWTYEKVNHIPYLDYSIQETFRLKPPIVAGLSRLTPAGGLQIDEVRIPADTIVSIPVYTIHRFERYWENAREFVPERWEGVSPDKLPWIPFTRGQFSCAGKNLAFMELRMVLSRIAVRYDVLFAPRENWREVRQGC
ncbi:cytochrome P450 [Xylariomycetidae sp. FL2044]|nr:cytochrome P450 [Xylariomycetidae sp. FL2044]